MDRFWSLAPADPEHVQLSLSTKNTSSIIGLSGNLSDSTDKERAEELRAEISLPSNSYSLLRMLAYVFYIPLYIAGPIVPFNSFARSRSLTFTSHIYIFVFDHF